MRWHFLISFVAIFFWGATSQAVVTFDWATVGNRGNRPDYTGFGKVDYLYRISKHEVTNAQYVEFLNAVDSSGANSQSLYSPSMSLENSKGFVSNGGINFDSGAPNGSKYQVKAGQGSHPVNHVSFLDAMRFANWLQNGQGSGSTESGAYVIGDGASESRQPNATFFIPSESEWYKAAYHKNDGSTGNYWHYPTSSDFPPFSDQPPGSDAPIQAQTANYATTDHEDNGYDDGFAVTGSKTIDGSQSYLTDVGAYPVSRSPYGTFDQGGNVWEWNEGDIRERTRVVRGGDWNSGLASFLSVSVRWAVDPSQESHGTGFRIASIPEPSAAPLVALGILGLVQMLHHRNWPRSIGLHSVNRG